MLVTRAYLGHFYVEAKAYEIQTVVRFNGIRFAEWHRGTLRVVMLGKTSMLWRRMTMEELTKWTENKDFYCTIRSGTTLS